MLRVTSLPPLLESLKTLAEDHYTWAAWACVLHSPLFQSCETSKTLASTEEQCEQKSQLCIAPGPQLKVGRSSICFIPKTFIVDFQVFPFTVPLGLRRGPPRSRPARFLQGLDVLAEHRSMLNSPHHCRWWDKRSHHGMTKSCPAVVAWPWAWLCHDKS